MLSIFIFAFTDHTAPVLTGAHSVLPPNPGMGFRPMTDIEKTLIKYNMMDDKTIGPFKDNIKYFLQPNKTDGVTPSEYNYLRGQDSGKFRDCTPEQMKGAKPKQVAEMASVQKHCLERGDYGFSEGKPCVIIKMNKVFEFKPEL